MRRRPPKSTLTDTRVPDATLVRSVHGGFPELLGVHLAQALVALAADGGFGLLEQPGHGFAEITDLGFLLPLAFSALDHGISGNEALEGDRKSTRLNSGH